MSVGFERVVSTFWPELLWSLKIRKLEKKKENYFKKKGAKWTGFRTDPNLLKVLVVSTSENYLAKKKRFFIFMFSRKK